MKPVPKHLQRLADEVDGWLDLRVPERALERLSPLLDDAEGRPGGLVLRIRAHVRLGRYPEALADLAELQRDHGPDDWFDLTEAFCRKRVQDLPGAIAATERVVARNHQAAIAHFNLGCYLALHGDRDRAIDAVTIACGLDAAFRDYARDEPDLDGLRNDPRFRELMRQAAVEAAAAGPNVAEELDEDADFDDDEEDEDDDEADGDGEDDGDQPSGGGPGRG